MDTSNIATAIVLGVLVIAVFGMLAVQICGAGQDSRAGLGKWLGIGGFVISLGAASTN